MTPSADSQPAAPRAPGLALRAAKAVFFDFDGPLCDVFSSYPAADVAGELKAVAQGFGIRLPALLASSSDPHGILRALGAAETGATGAEHTGALHAALEAKLAELEALAAKLAQPTPYASDLVLRLHAQGKRLLVTSNNAEGAVWAHLQAEGIDKWFDHVVGRNPSDASLMKPDPHCVKRALELVALPPGDGLLIGDQPTDAEAARAAGVPFLGYAPDPTRSSALRAAQAGEVVESLGDLRDLLPQPCTGPAAVRTL